MDTSTLLVTRSDTSEGIIQVLSLLQEGFRMERGLGWEIEEGQGSKLGLVK